MLRAKRRRTRTHDKAGNPIFNTMNSTPLQSVYKNVNNNLKQSTCCDKTIACRYDNCGTVTYVPEELTISFFGSSNIRDVDLIIDGIYILVPDTSVSPIYYNKEKGLYLGLYSGNTSTPPPPPAPSPIGRFWSIGYDYPGTTVAKWYFMSINNGSLLPEYSTDLYSRRDAQLWSMGVVTDTMSVTDIKPNFVVSIQKSEQYKCCLSSQNRNPIPGYRKQLVFNDIIREKDDNHLKCMEEDGEKGVTITTNNIYKDNYARICGSF